MEYHPLTTKIQNWLKENEAEYKYYEHEPVRTSEEAAKVRPDYSLEQGAKAIIVRIKRAGGIVEYAMLVLPGHLKFDGKKIKKIFGTKEITFATEEEISELTDGVQIGGIPPLGNLFGLKVLADKKMLDTDTIIFNAGDRSVSVAINSNDYVSLVKPEIVDIT
jgi:Ala-tRNA(Pro) deacylase